MCFVVSGECKDPSSFILLKYLVNTRDEDKVLRPWLHSCELQIQSALDRKGVQAPLRWPLIAFRLGKNGCAEDIEIITGSGDSAVDEHISGAIREINNFPLPASDLPFKQGLMLGSSAAGKMRLRFFSLCDVPNFPDRLNRQDFEAWRGMSGKHVSF